MLAKRGTLACEGDTVIVFHGHDDLRPLTLLRGAELHCKHGKFRHNDIIGAQYGSRVKGVSNAKSDPTIPSILILQCSADLWTMAVPHRTQIIYATDIAVIIMNLRVRPGSFVAEAGTGSGSLTHSFARAVAPTGHVFTFDFHKGRALQAREEFTANKVNHLVSSGWRDVCTTGKNTDSGDDTVEWWHGEHKEPLPGFGLPKEYVDALFLDVPAPWAAIENVLHVLKPGGILCTFSPCIEQTQRTCERLRDDPSEFIDIRTVEALTKFFDPVFKRTRTDEGTASGVVEGESEAAAVSSSGQKRPHSSYVETVHFRPSQSSKGHSAYLTFARRRLPRRQQ